MKSMDFPPFGIYEKALKPRGFKAMFLDAAKAGYSSFELSLDSTDARLARLDWDRAKIGELRGAAESAGVKIMTACLSGHKRYPLGSSDPDIAKAGMEILEKAVRLSGELGIRVIQIPGFDVYGREDSTYETRRRYVDRLAECAKIAERACVTLAVEPVEGNLLTVRDAMKAVAEIGSCWLQVYPDVANIKSLGIDPIGDLDFGAGHIVAVHMRDSLPGIYDATIPFGTGGLDFEGVFRKLDEIGFHGPLVVEMWNEEREDYMNYITQAREYMENCIGKVRNRSV